jgi:excisionase family DNA binding protein
MGGMADDEREMRRGTLRRDTLVGLGQVARQLGLGVRTVRQAADAGALPTYRLGVRRKVKVADVRAWIESCREPRR